MGRNSNYEKSVYNQLQEVVARLNTFEKESNVEHTKLNKKIDTLTEENTKLKIENQLLKDDNERLKRIINNDSSNSSLPPSSDQKSKGSNQYNGRTKSEKKPGAQKGHKGTTLTKKNVEEKLLSGNYNHQIVHWGTVSSKYIKKYVVDLEITPVIKEIRIYPDSNGKYHIPDALKSDVTYGAIVKALAVELYSEGVVSNERISNFINAISNQRLNVSKGSVYGFVKSFADKCSERIEQIENELMNAQTVCTDATNMTNNGAPCYIRNFSTNEAVLYTSMDRKNLETLKGISFLSNFAGTLEHDHETAMYHFGSAHGECNVHLLRYLKKNTEENRNSWSSLMAELLCNANSERKVRINNNHPFTADEIESYYASYNHTLAMGLEQNKKCKGKLAKQEEKKLLNRLEKYKENHLLFLHDFAVPFENNMSERDLRKCKNRQKMSGGFRKSKGHHMYCTIMSVVETCKRKNMHVFQNITKIFEGTPAIF